MTDDAVVPPLELELVPPEPPLLLVLPAEAEVPPEDWLLEPSREEELVPPLPALATDFPPEALLEERLLPLLPPPFPPLCDVEELDEPPPTFL